MAFLAALHVLCLKLFYRYTPGSCLDIDVKSVVFGNQAPGLNDAAVAKAVDERHRHWSEHLPREAADLWDTLSTFDPDSRDALFAHCVALSINAVYEPWNRRPRALAHADRIAEAVGLDVVTAGWSPTVDNYLGRVTKARIVEAVREARGRNRGPAHRASEEGRDGGEGARAARRFRLDPRAVAYVRPGDRRNVFAV